MIRKHDDTVTVFN